MATKLLTRNMGSFDRAMRAFVIAPVAIGLALGLGATSIGGIILLAAAGIMLATGATGVCPAYVPFGIDTRAPHAAAAPTLEPELQERSLARKEGRRWQRLSRS